MKRSLFISSLLFALAFPCMAQVSINSDGSAPNNSAMLDVQAANRGILIPRITTASRNQIPSPARGLLIYNSETNQFNFFNGSLWFQLESSFVSSTTGAISQAGGMSINATANIPPANSAMLDINNPTRGLLIPRTATTLIPSPATGLIIYDTTINFLSYYNGAQWVVPCAISTGIAGAGGTQSTICASVGNGNPNQKQSAILDVAALNMGVLIPRLTNGQRNAILPVTGLVIYNSSSNNIEYYNGTAWVQLTTNLLAAPATGTHIPATTQITWNWSLVAGATGYKWNTVNTYATATDIGSATTKTETGLLCNTPYTRYVWACNACTHSAPVMLSQTTLTGSYCCGMPLTDSRDGKTYSTILIGTQCWMAQNLNVGNFIHAYYYVITPPNMNPPQLQTNNNIIEKYCYADNISNCDLYGGLYMWDELMNYSPSSNTNPSGIQGICPAGWHIPSDAEWCQLETILDITVFCSGTGNLGTDVGGKMKETGTTHWNSPNTGATNASGFKGLPGGFVTGIYYIPPMNSWSFTFYNIGDLARFWSSTKDASSNEIFQQLSNNSSQISRSAIGSSLGISARCIQN